MGGGVGYLWWRQGQRQRQRQRWRWRWLWVWLYRQRSRCTLVNAVVVLRNCRDHQCAHSSGWWRPAFDWHTRAMDASVYERDHNPNPSSPPPMPKTCSWDPHAPNGDVLSAVECRISLTSATASPTATASCILHCARSLCVCISEYRPKAAALPPPTSQYPTPNHPFTHGHIVHCGESTNQWVLWICKKCEVNGKVSKTIDSIIDDLSIDLWHFFKE